MTAHRPRRSGLDPAGLPHADRGRADVPRGVPSTADPLPDTGTAGGAGTVGTRPGTPGRTAGEADREWDPFTRLLLLLEVSGRRSWLEGLGSSDHN
ncbi:hypothetical protein [Streptomyces albus]|uniref:hypothetical protein n=1 Tax=Streptomyces albus TaxID=1888 RepID=UPI00131DA2E5|nr:hypothetical protein [Streptomyces albus]